MLKDVYNRGIKVGYLDVPQGIVRTVSLSTGDYIVRRFTEDSDYVEFLVSGGEGVLVKNVNDKTIYVISKVRKEGSAFYTEVRDVNGGILVGSDKIGEARLEDFYYAGLKDFSSEDIYLAVGVAVGMVKYYLKNPDTVHRLT